MKKTNNKGFSLVELIIVIAIMAVLVAVMAPSFIKYVEQSRASTDMQNVASITSAIQVWAVDPDAGNPSGNVPNVGVGTSYQTANVALDTAGGSVTINQTGALTLAGNGCAAALANAGLDPAAIQTQARTTWGTTTLLIEYTVNADGSVAFTYTPAAISGQDNANNNNNP